MLVLETGTYTEVETKPKIWRASFCAALVYDLDMYCWFQQSVIEQMTTTNQGRRINFLKKSEEIRQHQ